ncbi:MAG: hypothetical protein HY343_05735, partial [Lentisphaerae bacterium]|nr:hypothetical protein [Lentisphaerota bacterium]
SNSADDWWSFPAQGDPDLQTYAIRKIGELSFPPYSTGGMAWATSTTNTGYTARQSLPMLAFSNKMYIFGGYNLAAISVTNDVLVSQNGTNWTRIVTNAEWNPRYGHSVAAISNSIVLLAGYNNALAIYTNDVWASYNQATNWTKIVTNAPWLGRIDGALQAFNGRLVYLGGSAIGVSTNDVWVSDTAGSTWSKINNAPWSKRNQFGSLIHDGKLWVMGGNNSISATLTNDVWWTSDLTNWVQATTTAGWNKSRGLAAESINGLMYVYGGITGATAAATTREIWSSSDGISWMKEEAVLPQEIYNFAHCVFSNLLWAYNGVTTNTTATPAVFYGSTNQTATARISTEGPTNIVFSNINQVAIHGTLIIPRLKLGTNEVISNFPSASGGAVQSVNGYTGTVVLTTDDITEGATNKYLGTNSTTLAALQAAAPTNALAADQAAAAAAQAPTNATAADRASGWANKSNAVEQAIVTRLEKDANYSIAAGDSGKLLDFSGSGGVTSWVPDDATYDFPDGATLYFRWSGTGTNRLTLGASNGVVLYSPDGLKLKQTNSAAAIMKISNDAWWAIGQLEQIP